MRSMHHVCLLFFALGAIVAHSQCLLGNDGDDIETAMRRMCDENDLKVYTLLGLTAKHNRQAFKQHKNVIIHKHGVGGPGGLPVWLFINQELPKFYKKYIVSIEAINTEDKKYFFLDYVQLMEDLTGPDTRVIVTSCNSKLLQVPFPYVPHRADLTFTFIEWGVNNNLLVAGLTTKQINEDQCPNIRQFLDQYDKQHKQDIGMAKLGVLQRTRLGEDREDILEENRNLHTAIIRRNDQRKELHTDLNKLKFLTVVSKDIDRTLKRVVKDSN